MYIFNAFPESPFSSTFTLRRGVPNYYGPQRTGKQGSTARAGRDHVLGARIGGRGKKRKRYQVGEWLLRLQLNALQSALFNSVLGSRIENDKFNADDDEKIMQLDGFSKGYTSFSCPMFGAKSDPPTDLEMGVLKDFGLSLDDFKKLKHLGLHGGRRPGKLPLEALQLTVEADLARERSLRFRFVLPPGSYATSVLREVMKAPLATKNAFV